MGKIDLSLLKNTNKIYAIKDVQNNAKKDIQKNVNIQKDENKFIKPETKPQNNNNFPTFNEVMNQVNKNINNSSLKDEEFKNNDIKNDDVKKDDTTLSENERNKLIALLNLYLCEFPEKLSKYKSKQLYKLSNSELLLLKDQFKNEVSTSNNLNIMVQASCKALEMYEYLMVDYLDVNIKGVSNIKDTQEYKDTVKACLLKYLDSSLVSQVEPEMKLAYLILSNSLVCHQMNSMNDTNSKINNIEQHNIPQLQQKNIKVDEEADIIKSMKLRNLNYKQEYTDL